ncbi:MAG TPA: site-2 protease family protein [Candidatus Nanoarchaeia archaeon]|nr:site-2 protease family protein [Candidatus Nanoarchaeia archaeon]
MKYSSIEKHDLIKAWFAISLAFTIAFNGFSNFINVFLLSVVIVGLSFLLHELAHKYLAQKYGCWAEFRADNKMLLVMLVISFFHIIFAAPGAVYISGHVSTEKNGKISLAGPLTNILLAILSLILIKINFFPSIAVDALRINAWLALFNLIPFMPFDGAKVFYWNKLVWFIAVAVSFSLFLI